MTDVPLSPETLAIISAILQIAAAVMAVITLTGFGKWLAEKAGRTITPNQVRAISGVAAVLVTLIAGVVSGGVPGVGAIPGIGAMPTGADPQAWLLWVLGAATPLTLFANAVWKYVYRPEPEVVVVAPPIEPAPAPASSTAATR